MVIVPRAFHDERGFFMESYNQQNFADSGFNEEFVQDNHSVSKKGVLRGMHYQIEPSPMGKLVRCIKGRIFDAGIDVRKGSPTFGQWFGEELSGENMKMIYFPPGIAHGFLTLEDDSHVYYKCTGLYSRENERAMAYDDPEVGVKWPIKEAGGNIILSAKDQAHPRLKDADLF